MFGVGRIAHGQESGGGRAGSVAASVNETRNKENASATADKEAPSCNENKKKTTDRVSECGHFQSPPVSGKTHPLQDARFRNILRRAA